MGLGYYGVSFVIEAKMVQLNYWHCTKYEVLYQIIIQWLWLYPQLPPDLVTFIEKNPY